MILSPWTSHIEVMLQHTSEVESAVKLLKPSLGSHSLHPQILDWRHTNTALEDSMEMPLGQARLPRHLTQTQHPDTPATLATNLDVVASHERPDLAHGVFLGHESHELRLAALAGAEAGALRLAAVVVEDDVCPAGKTRLANGPAVDLGGADAVDEESVGVGVAVLDSLPAGVVIVEEGSDEVWVLLFD